MRQHPVSRVNQVPTHMVPQVCSPSHDVYHVQLVLLTTTGLPQHHVLTVCLDSLPRQAIFRHALPVQLVDSLHRRVRKAGQRVIRVRLGSIAPRDRRDVSSARLVAPMRTWMHPLRALSVRLAPMLGVAKHPARHVYLDKSMVTQTLQHLVQLVFLEHTG